MRLLDKYLISDDESRKCFHCHKEKPMARKNICDKCVKELAAWRSKSANTKGIV